MRVALGIILWCSLVFRVDRGSLSREEIVLSLTSGLCSYKSASCRWTVVTAIDWRADTLAISTLLLLHHEVLELVWLVIRYVDSLMRLPSFLVHRMWLRSGSWVAQESIGSHHPGIVSSNVTIALLRCSIACSWICPVVVIVWWIWRHHVNSIQVVIIVMWVCNARLLLRASTRYSFTTSLVIIDISEVFGARDFSVSGEAAALTRVSFMSSRVRLRVDSYVTHLLCQCTRIKLRDEATLFFLSDAHVTDGADINHAIVCAAHVVE